MTERTIPIFESLLDSHYGNQRHRYHAQLGYALKDQEQPDWEKARDSLENAAALLEESNRPMSPYYKFNWALCAIELDRQSDPHKPLSCERRKAIVEAIKTGSQFWKLKGAILENDTISDWLQRNELSFDAIGLATEMKLAVNA
jgi:hypothetical protein